MKLLKQRFSVWYNRSHQRYGTLWSERFKSVLVEAKSGVMTVAAYIDLNAVRGWSGPDDPKTTDSAATATPWGERLRSPACVGLVQEPANNWRATQASYRRRCSLAPTAQPSKGPAAAVRHPAKGHSL